MRTITDILLVVSLLGLVVGMGVHYGTEYDDHWPYPMPEDVDMAYDQYEGERVLLFGEVLEVNEARDYARILIEYGDGSFELTIRKFSADVQHGGTVQVFGTLVPNRELRATNIVVVNDSSMSDLYKYVVSVVGALLVIGLFLRYWRIDIRRFKFQER